MRRIDELHMEFPFAASRMLRDRLLQECITVGRLYVATLMKKMAIEAIHRRPNPSKPAPGHKIYPYLLRKLAIVRPNQVCATDISYTPMATRASSILWRSWTGSAARYSAIACRSAWRPIFASRRWKKHWPAMASRKFSTPTRAASSPAWRSPSMLVREKIAISMDGRGAWRDNVIVERLWRSVKYEEVYLHAYAAVSVARAQIGRYLNFYNVRRPHSSLDAKTPDQAYFDNLPVKVAA
jgi:putative transposase